MATPQPAMSADQMRGYLSEVGTLLAAWAGSPIDQRDLHTIARALKLKDEREAYDIVRRYSPGTPPREIPILLEPVRVTTSYVPQSAHATMARIAAGVDPWVSFSDFLEDWTYAPESRSELMKTAPSFVDPKQRRWAALLAATVEALCERDGQDPPDWTQEAVYRLPRPWYLYQGTGRIRDWMRESTPQPFAKRKIWSGDRVLRRA